MAGVNIIAADTDAEAQAQRMLACSFVGSPETLRNDLKAFMTKNRADELMVATAVYDHGARLRS